MTVEFTDIILIYPSTADDAESGLWVAHALRCDQVGVGSDPIEASRELAFALRTLLEEAAIDPSVRIDQPAPSELMKRLSGAKPLPEDLWERVKSAITACGHHDSNNYWRPSDDGAEEWGDSPLYREIQHTDLSVA